MSERCPKCEEFIFFDSHTCPPLWHVRQVFERGDREDWRPIYATGASEAAEKWAANYDNYGDYTIVGGSPEMVEVKADGVAKPIVGYIVHGESVPSYTASTYEMPKPFSKSPVDTTARKA